MLTEREDEVAPSPAAGTGAPARSLNILHVLCAPVGGLFRHVLDLVRVTRYLIWSRPTWHSILQAPSWKDWT